MVGRIAGKIIPRRYERVRRFPHRAPGDNARPVLTVTDHDLGMRPAGAALVEMTYRHGGIAAVKALMAGGRTDAQLRTALEKGLEMSWPEIERMWRAHILDYALDPTRKRD